MREQRQEETGAGSEHTSDVSRRSARVANGQLGRARGVGVLEGSKVHNNTCVDAGNERELLVSDMRASSQVMRTIGNGNADAHDECKAIRQREDT